LKNLDELTAEYGRKLRDGDTEAALSLLRQNGYSKLDSIKAVTAITGMGFIAARDLIHLSRTWEDARVNDETFELASWEELARHLGGAEDEQS
jgi:ribosomal protein L7/L12